MNTTTQKPGRNALCPCGSRRKFKICCGAVAIRELKARAKDALDVLVLMPTRGTICVETSMALYSNMSGCRRALVTVTRRPVDVARNELAAAALNIRKDVDVEFALWVDDDAFWPQGTVEQMLTIMRGNPRIDVLAGFFSKRQAFGAPVAFRVATDPRSFPDVGRDCSLGDVVEVQMVGAHFMMHRISLLERLPAVPFKLLENDVTEDAAFCARIREAGGGIFVSTGSVIAHINATDGSAYIPGQPALKVVNGKLVHGEARDIHSYGEAVDGAVARFSALAVT